MPINYKNYNPDWKETSKRVIAEAGGRCELCGAPNKSIVCRPTDKFKYWRTWYFDFELKSHELEKFKQVKIILTVHHINSNKKDDSKHNLIALCQRCHLRLDRAKRFK